MKTLDFIHHMAWSITTSFWILSPAIYLILKVAGVYDFEYDSLVFIVFAGISTFTMFMTYRHG